MNHVQPQIAVFIDDGNMWSVYRSMKKLIDFRKINSFLEQKFAGKIYKVFFYKAYPTDDSRAYSLSPQHKFMTFLKKGLGFVVRSKELKTIIVRDRNNKIIFDTISKKPKTIEKGNFDVEIAIDAVWFLKEYDLAVFFSGDSDFQSLINFLRKSQKLTYVFSSKNSVSSELLSSSDGYFEIADCQEIHGNVLQNRSHRNSSLE